MGAIRKMAMVVNHVHVDDEDIKDVAFWLTKTPAERLAEVCRLRQDYFAWADGVFPAKMEKVLVQKAR